MIRTLVLALGSAAGIGYCGRCEATPPAQAPISDGLEAEWRARRWALSPEEHRDLILAALNAEDWSLVHSALDALARSGPSARWGIEQLAASDLTPLHLLNHSHPNVRARALDLCTAAGWALHPDSPTATTLAGDTLDRVRLALVRHLHWTAAPKARADLLVAIAGCAGQAGAAAQRLLLSSGPGARLQQLRWLADQGPELEFVLLEHLQDLQRAPVSADLIVGLRGLTRGHPAAAALVEGLALHGQLDGAPLQVDRERLVRGWFLLGPAREDDLDGSMRSTQRRLAYNTRLGWAREGDRELGRLLFRAGVELAGREGYAIGSQPTGFDFEGHLLEAQEFLGGPGQGASFLLECGAEALSMREALALAIDLPDDLIEEVWTMVGARAHSMNADSDWEGLQGFLSPTRSRSLRWAVASLVSDSWVQVGEAGVAEEMLFGLLQDPDREMRRMAFRWLCDGPSVARRLPRLHKLWLRFSPAERLLHLRSLPRKVAAEPFLPDLLELCATPTGRTAPILELFAPFQDRETVQSVLQGWLAEALVELENASDGESYRAAQWRGKAIALALGPRPATVYARTLKRVIAAPPGTDFFSERSVAFDPEWSKTLAGLLARSAEGRAHLAQFLGPDTPRRIRVEAGIGLLSGGGDTSVAEEVLRRDYKGCDVDLGMRVLTALGRSSTVVTRGFLVNVVLNPSESMEERLAGLDVFTRTEDLQAVLLGVRQAELILNAVDGLRRLAESGDASAANFLVNALDRVERRAGSAQERHSDSQVAGELLLACIRSGAGGEALEGRCFAGAMQATGADLVERFRGRRPAATEFRFRLELTAAKALAERGRLGAALAHVGEWGRLDGRLLLELARVAEREGQLDECSSLLQAARVSMLGEPLATDTPELLDRATLVGYRQAVRAERWDDVSNGASRMLAATILRGVRSQVFESQLGRFDRRLGVDPFADLGSARLQAAAWAALEGGDREGALELVEQAEVWLGASARAHRGQARLREAVEE